MTSAAAAAPRVTVLMAVYDGERFVREAVESILAQSFGDFELLVVDDGSTDATPDILAGYADSRVRVLRNDRNLGLAASLNRGLGAARGALVARQDADDVSERERLARQVAFLDEHDDVALVGCSYTEIDPAGAPIRRVRLPSSDLELRWALLFYSPFAHSAVTFRRDVVPGAVGGYDEAFAYSQDYDLWRRVASRFAVANLREPLLRLRTNPWSMTETYGDRTQEGPRARRAELARLLALREEELDDARFRALRSLVLDAAADDRAAALERAANDLLRLHRTFREREGLASGAGAAHEAAVRARAAERLHDMAFEWLARGEREEARALLALARRVGGRAVPSRRQLGLYLRLLAARGRPGAAP